MLSENYGSKSRKGAKTLSVLLQTKLRLRNIVSGCHERARRAFRNTEAAELLEFALAVPLLLVMVIGILDFSHAYHIKQKLTDSARAGARLGASESTSDITQTSITPPSVQSIYEDVVTYLQNAGVDTTSLSSTAGACTAPSGTTPPQFCWEYTSTSTYGLQSVMVERDVQITNAGTANLNGTEVTVTYNYDWTYGFNHIIKMIAPSASVSSSILLESDALMANQGS